MMQTEKQEVCNQFIFLLYRFKILDYNADLIYDLIEYYEKREYDE